MEPPEGRAADGYSAPAGGLRSSDQVCRRGGTSARKPVRKRLRRRADAFPGNSLGDDSGDSKDGAVDNAVPMFPYPGEPPGNDCFFRPACGLGRA